MTNLFSKPKTSEVKPPAPIPDENDPAILEAGRRRRMNALASGGRQSTILSGGGENLGGGDFSRQKMG